VDCSDHEVNIKILLNEVANRAPARSEKAQSDADAKRSALLEGMTDEVSALVLDNNYRQVQTLALTFADPELGCKEFNDLIISLRLALDLIEKLNFSLALNSSSKERVLILHQPDQSSQSLRRT